MITRPAPAVVDCLDRQPRVTVWTTSITVFEVRYGIALLPIGSRPNRLERDFERVLSEAIEDRIASFDPKAAEETAVLMAERRRSGRTGELRDAVIAGIVTARHATLATRNTRHFADLSVAVIDPWAA